MTSRPAVGLPVVELGGGAVSTPLLPEVWRVAGLLADDSVASRIAEADPSVWGPAPRAPEPRPEADTDPRAGSAEDPRAGSAEDPRVGSASAEDGLGWAALPRTSRPLIGQVDALREAFRVAGAARVLLVGDARWTLGARVLASVAVPAGSGASPRSLLTVVDSPDPGAVSHALATDLDGIVLVVADPFGDTEWVAAVHELLAEALAAEIGPERAHARTVVLTEAGSRLDERARATGSVVITTERDVPGVFSVLGAPGIVPAGLAGAPVGTVLDEAREVVELLAADDAANPALELAGALVATADGPVRIVPPLDRPELAEWVAALVGAAGGRPVLVDPTDDTGLPFGPVFAPATAEEPTEDTPTAAPEPGTDADAVRTGGSTGAELLLWQIAAAAAARLLDADAFAPDAPASPVRAPSPDPGPVLREIGTDGIVTTHAGDWFSGAADEALQALVRAVPEDGHLAVWGWLDPADDASVAVLRAELARRTGLPVTFGWGPRDRAVLAPFRRDTPRPGAVLLLTGDAPDDLAPDPGPALASLALREAGVVAADIATRGVPVLRLHLHDRVAGLVVLARAVQALQLPQTP
ncbi:glucose-6-phosphate isomerase [Pseudonocardia ailaonensis]|uniref:Glucose-6-phosphate isomerase n=1 Tax=Pseudonocardia ailaonensis TaxID=367279 RepID=A0ABN2ML54_9PSEU